MYEFACQARQRWLVCIGLDPTVMLRIRSDSDPLGYIILIALCGTFKTTKLATSDTVQPAPGRL